MLTLVLHTILTTTTRNLPCLPLLYLNVKACLGVMDLLLPWAALLGWWMVAVWRGPYLATMATPLPVPPVTHHYPLPISLTVRISPGHPVVQPSQCLGSTGFLHKALAHCRSDLMFTKLNSDSIEIMPGSFFLFGSKQALAISVPT